MAAKVKFGADTTEFSRGLDRMQSQVQGLGAKLGKSLKGGLAGIGAALVGQIGIGKILESFKEFERVADLSKQLGISTTEVQKLSMAAKLGGADIEILAKTFTAASQRVREYQAGLKEVDGEDASKIGRALKALGISASEFSGASTQNQVLMVAEGMAKMGNAADANSSALALLGTRAKELIPMLGDLNGMKEAFAQTPILSEEEIARIEKFGDAMDTMGAKLKSFTAKVGLGILGVGDTFKWAYGQAMEFYTGAGARSDKLLQRTREINAALAARAEEDKKQKITEEEMSIGGQKVLDELSAYRAKESDINKQNEYEKLNTLEKIAMLEKMHADQLNAYEYAAAADTLAKLNPLKTEQAGKVQQQVEEEQKTRENALESISSMEDEIALKRLSQEEQVAALRQKALEQAASGDYAGAAKTAQALQTQFGGAQQAKNYSGVIADSLRRVGGGGVAVSSTVEISRGILQENKQMTKYLAEIKTSIRGQGGDNRSTFK